MVEAQAPIPNREEDSNGNVSVVEFPDPALESAIREAIRKPVGNILYTDLAGLVELSAGHRNISNLEGIQHCLDLKELYLSFNSLVDIGALAPLSKLEVLLLNGNQLVNIEPLAGLVQLVDLRLYDNQIDDITFLMSLTKLEYLGLDYNAIVDIRPLSGLTRLWWLSAESNQISDVLPLSPLTKLEYLGLDHNAIVDVSGLASLINLEELRLPHNHIVDISALVRNPGLSRYDNVYIYDNPFDLTQGSPAMLDIEVLLDRGVDVTYDL
ncbi:leucine-rich repeat domain-containing protein [Candidatus Bipolaricaulota bacterium]